MSNSSNSSTGVRCGLKIYMRRGALCMDILNGTSDSPVPEIVAFFRSLTLVTPIFCEPYLSKPSSIHDNT